MKTGSIRSGARTLEPATVTEVSINLDSASKDYNTPKQVISRSDSSSKSVGADGQKLANGTFLTECSFGVAHDHLVQVITDVHPFEPHWENLSAIDLGNKKIESVARLKEFLPKLSSLSMYV